MIDKVSDQRKRRNENNEGRKNYGKPRNKLKRATDKAEKVYLENICEEVMEFQRIGHYEESRLKRKA
jgi:hypothetical protein